MVYARLYDMDDKIGGDYKESLVGEQVIVLMKR